jgi:SynChlorMet cassette radical SAM/SPASM protein ScmE
MLDTRLHERVQALKVMSTPRSVDVDITNRCNLRCKYCYHFSGPGDIGDDLSGTEWLHFFQELRDCAVMNIALAGGEPFLREDLLEIVQGIAQNRMRFTILSNGTLISDNMARFLSLTGRCDGVQISVDGSNAETHDACRGKGNFSKAMDGINCLQKHGVPVDVRVTIHRHNVRDLDGIATLLLDDVGLSGFSTNAASYMGLCRKNMEQVGLSVEDRIVAMETLLELNNKYDNRIGAQAGPLADAAMWSEMELTRRNGKDKVSNRGHLTGCGCARDKIAVRADGVIVPCTMLSHVELGRINKDDFKEIWQNHPEMQKLRLRHKIPLSDFAFCQGCEYVNYCTGNCPGLAFTMTGEMNHPSPDACLRLFLESGGHLPNIGEQ